MDEEYREVLQVLSVSSGENPYIAFQHETGIVTKDGELVPEEVQPEGGKRMPYEDFLRGLR